jgi:galactonate dehydratase
MTALRRALGYGALLMVDLHWKFEAPQASALVQELAPHAPVFVEAPVKPEDIAGLAEVCEYSPVAVAAGEEWYTEHEARWRLERCRLGFVQPEMAHVGITQFQRIARLARRHGAQLAPHATIGTGLFLAASLHASAAQPGLWRHEWQHSVFERNLPLLATDMRREGNAYVPPQGSGLGAAPGPRFWDHAQQLT